MIIPGNETRISLSQHDPLKSPFKSSFFLVTGFTQSIPRVSPFHTSAGLIRCWNSGASEQRMAPLSFLKNVLYLGSGWGGKKVVKLSFSQGVADCWIWDGKTLMSK